MLQLQSFCYRLFNCYCCSLTPLNRELASKKKVKEITSRSCVYAYIWGLVLS